MLTCQKERFFLPPDHHYLNCAYMAPLAKVVEAAGIEGIRLKRIPSRIRPEDFFRESDRVRSLFARLVGAKTSSIALIPSASYGIATIARNLPVERGRNIVLLEEQFPSNVLTWRRLASERGAEIRTVSPGEAGSGRASSWNRRLLESIDARTAVVAVPHVHWADGTLFDLEAVSDRARDVDAALIVDGTQSVGALPFDVGRVKPAALVCAGYKWLLGPYSMGAAYFDERYHAGVPLEENWILRLGSEEFSRLVNYEDRYHPGAVRYDVGERSNFILVPMLAAALEMVLEWQPERIQAYCERLIAGLVEEAPGLGYRMEAAGGRAHHLFGIRTPDGVDPNALREELDRRGLSVSVRGSALRVSPHVYNDLHDVDALLDALRAASHVSA